MDLRRLTRWCATTFLLSTTVTSIAAAQKASGNFLVPNIGTATTTGGSYSERGSFVFDLTGGLSLHNWKYLALNGAASVSNTFVTGSDLTCAIVVPSVTGTATLCGAHMPKLMTGAVMVGLQTSSAQPVLFGIATGPAYVHGTDYNPSSSTISAKQDAFGMQSRVDLAIRIIRPVWINISAKSLLMPNYRAERLHNKSASIGIRFQ